MTFEVITIFPDFFTSILSHGLLKRALAGGQVSVRLHDLRDFADERHRTVDDRPFGGGPGMVFKPEPLFRAVDALRAESGRGETNFPVILLSPQGRLYRQEIAEDLAHQSRVALICGRYEGVDERVATALATDEVSIGNYVLAGGELAASIIMESVTRLVPGVLGNEESPRQESFAGGIDGDGQASDSRGLLDFPQYTRPPEFRGLAVPDVLLSGDHRAIGQWRRRQALIKTWRRRPELLQGARLDKRDLELIEELKQEAATAAERDHAG